ncbi:MAG: UvrD-helicase domain-containing protein [Thermodesulfobacteriota bacterium]
MRYIADLHVHSRFSRATARDLDLEHLHIFSQLKGITVVATGDFTHPEWFAELREKLEPAEDGLFRLKKEIAEACDQRVPPSCRRPVRFILSTEISNIYKKNDRTRKNHHLVFMPDLDTAARFNTRLEAIGNIRSDGRPILGLDARNLLEIVLETSADAFLIPAHIWTPWFSLFGSKSGFDAIGDCFEDLTPHIFAVETGLSSDPAMNWRVSGIDGLTLVSNSDAHSPSKLGREACILDTALSYPDLRRAIKTGDPAQFLGTYEFFPEEGKYHFDGHRACGVCFSPDITRQYHGLCPACGKPLTLGVLYRVEELADREPGKKPGRHHPYYSLVPLEEILSEIAGVGSKSKKVAAAYDGVLEKLGPEFDVLYTLPAEEIRKSGVALLDVAVGRVRDGHVHLTPGYDGEYGRVRVFTEDEKEALQGQQHLFPDDTGKTDAGGRRTLALRVTVAARKPDVQPSLPGIAAGGEPAADQPADPFKGLNSRQMEAVSHGDGPLMIVAGPGSGKTHTLTCRIARLIRENRVAAENILAITFTNRAAAEMARRIEQMVDKASGRPQVSTFHAFCFSLLKEGPETVPVILDETDQRQMMADAVESAAMAETVGKLSPGRFAEVIARAKQRLLSSADDLSAIAGGLPPEILSTVYQSYQRLMSSAGLMDFEDLIAAVVHRLEQDDAFREDCRRRFPYVFVDEYQDINYAQYRLIRALVPPDGNICVIGDPDQAIYGFRGSDAAFFQTFDRDFPNAATVCLDRSYRSTETILSASYHVISRQPDNDRRVRVYSGITGLPVITVAGLATDRAEATFVGKTIESLVGGLGFFSVDSGQAGYEDDRNAYGFADIAVLFRTRAQGNIFADVLGAAGIPFHLVSRENMYAAKGMAELISLWRLCNDGGTMMDFERVLAAGGGKITPQAREALAAWKRKHGFSVERMMRALIRFPVDGIGSAVQNRLAALAGSLLTMRDEMRPLDAEEQLLYLLVRRSDIRAVIDSRQKTRDACDALVREAAAGGLDPGAFLAAVNLSSDADAQLPEADRVRLMTIHAAKGLEFPVVFVAGCEDGYLPLKRGEDEAVDEAEERRLLYVAMTRARDQLFFTYAKQRQIFGKMEQRRISPFAEDIESRLKVSAGLGKGKKPRGGPVQMELF